MFDSFECFMFQVRYRCGKGKLIEMVRTLRMRTFENSVNVKLQGSIELFVCSPMVVAIHRNFIHLISRRRMPIACRVIHYLYLILVWIRAAAEAAAFGMRVDWLEKTHTHRHYHRMH